MPVLIKIGGAYVRYDSKYARDIDLCDCTCDDQPPGVCCCDEMGDTLYMRITHYEPSPDCDGTTVTVSYDVELSVSDTDANCGFMYADLGHDCTSEAWTGSWTSNECDAFGNYITYTRYFTLGCLKANIGAAGLTFGICMSNSLSPAYGYETLGETPCPVDLIEADFTLGLPFIYLEIRRVPFAEW